MWEVRPTPKVEKEIERLPKKIFMSFSALLRDFEKLGYHRHEWPHFKKFSGSHQSYHCHLRGSQKPTYVACWRVIDKEKKIIEVYYVGTHENAPY